MSVEDTLKEVAVSHWGCPRERVDELWTRHEAWANKSGAMPGGNPWRRLVEQAKADEVIPTVPSRSDEDRRRKAREDAEYRRQAKTGLADYADILSQREASGHPLNEWDRMLLDSHRRMAVVDPKTERAA